MIFFSKIFLKLSEGLRFLRRSKKAYFSFIVLLVIAVIALIAPLISPYNPTYMSNDQVMKNPTKLHIMGTDLFGRDVFSRIIYGARISLGISLLVVGFAIVVGVPLGLLAGYYGGWVDSLIMRISDIVLSFPWLLLALSIATIVGPGGKAIVIALGTGNIPLLARLVRGVVLSIREQEYIEGAIVSGESNSSIIWRYIFPNCLAPVIVQSSIIMSLAILGEAAISYMGLGIQAPTPSWGLMLSEGADVLWPAPFLSIFPGIAIVIMVMSINLFADGLRDLLDPRYTGGVKFL